MNVNIQGLEKEAVGVTPLEMSGTVGLNPKHPSNPCL